MLPVVALTYRAPRFSAQAKERKGRCCQLCFSS